MTPGLKACLLCILGDNNWIGKKIIYQFAYEISYIIMKIWPCITPIMIFFFNILSQQQHINKQIIYSV